MSAHKLDKLEQRLYRTIKDIREATSPNRLMTYIRRFGRLEHQYFNMTGSKFNPARDHEVIQDVEWRY